MKYLFSKTYEDNTKIYEDITKIRETIINVFLIRCKDSDKLRRFIWDISPIIDSIKEKYFRMLNKGLSSWQLDYRLKREV